MSSSIFTFLGDRIDPLNPNPDNIHIEDIAHALSNQCRFGGHTNRFYSVAQHSMAVAVLSKENYMEALLHDATEAFLVDIPRPIKHKFSEYMDVEKKLQEVIFTKYSLTYPIPAEVQALDDVVLYFEMGQLINGQEHSDLIKQEVMDEYGIPEGTLIDPLAPQLAERYFLEMFDGLLKQKWYGNFNMDELLGYFRQVLFNDHYDVFSKDSTVITIDDNAQ